MMKTIASLVLILGLFQGGQCLSQHHQHNRAERIPAGNVGSIRMNHGVQPRADLNCTGVEGFYPNPDDPCGPTYFTCFENVSYPTTCPDGTVFDPPLAACTPEATASCKQSSSVEPTSTATTNTPTSTTIPTTPPTTSTVPITSPSTTGPVTTRTTTTPGPFTCPSKDGFYAIPGTCGNQYYSCVSGTATPQTCPSTAVFDPATRKCTSTSTATCANLKCSEPEGFFPLSPGICIDTYYTCFDSVGYIEACPTGSVFDPVISTCTKPETSSCQGTGGGSTSVSGSPTGSTTSVSGPTTTFAPFTCAADGGYPYPGSCTLYYVCVKGVATVNQCEVGLIYNAVYKLCDFPCTYPPCDAEYPGAPCPNKKALVY